MSTATADVIIVGGGIVGASIAYQTARRSNLRVLVVEKGRGLGEGSTGGSSAITRQRYTRDEMVRLVKDANRVFHGWSEYTQIANPRATYHPVGVLWALGHTKTEVAADADRLRSFGVQAKALSSTELTELFPAVSTCSQPFSLEQEGHDCSTDSHFLFEEDAGYFEPVSALEDVCEAATREGVEIRLRAEVTDIRTSNGRVVGVTLDDGSRIDAGLVINAAGPWCNRINEMVGIGFDWQLVPTRIAVGHRSIPPQLLGEFPVICDPLGGVYLRPEAGGQQVIFGSTQEEDEQERADPDTYNRLAEQAFLQSRIQSVHHRLPSLPYQGTVGGMSAMYTVNRMDVHPVVGMSPVDGFFWANGFSGHGFKEAPMIGAQVAQFITNTSATFDTNVPMDFFSPDRAPLITSGLNVLA